MSAGRRSVLDAVHDDAVRLARRLGVRDRERLAEYLEAVRAVERRIERQDSERQASARAERAPPRAPAELTAAEPDYRGRLRLMYELTALALCADATRVVTLMLGNAGSNRSYPFLEVPEGHHDLSHHGGQADKLEKIRKINRFHVEEFAAFCQRLAAMPEGTGTVLDACALTYGAGIADGNSHAHHDLPVVVVGGAGGRMQGGRALRLRQETPLSNLYLTYLRFAGDGRASFGDSTGTLLL